MKKSNPFALFCAVVFCTMLAIGSAYFLYPDLTMRFTALTSPANHPTDEATITSIQDKNVTVLGITKPWMCQVTYRWESNTSVYQGVTNKMFCSRFLRNYPVEVYLTATGGYELYPLVHETIFLFVVLIFSTFGLSRSIRRFRYY